jgi:hypothetical protein
MWVVNWDDMPPKHESARDLRVEPDNASRLTLAPTHTSNAQRVAVRMPFQTHRAAVQIPGVVTVSALLVPIIIGSVVSVTGTPSTEPTLPIDPTSWGSSADSGSRNISRPSDAGEILANTGEALAMDGDSSDDEGDPALPDDTAEDSQGVEDAAWVPPVHGVTVTLRQPRTMATWTVFQHDDVAQHEPFADTNAVRAAQNGRASGAE